MDEVILETDGENDQIARNVYGINLISRTVDSETLFYMYNGHADVTALINSATDTIVGTYYYDAFGNIENETGDKDNPFRYSGYQYDEETELYYLNARYYDSKIARFLQEDTYTGQANDPLSLNLYTYCANNPLIYYDPTGHNYMKQGNYGDSVKAMQEQLIDLGYNLGPCGADGDFGSATQSAIKQFQRDNGLQVDGVVGNQTYSTLDTLHAVKDAPVYAQQSAQSAISSYEVGAIKDDVIIMSKQTFNDTLDEISNAKSSGTVVKTKVVNNQVKVTVEKVTPVTKSESTTNKVQPQKSTADVSDDSTNNTSSNIELPLSTKVKLAVNKAEIAVLEAVVDVMEPISNAADAAGQFYIENRNTISKVPVVGFGLTLGEGLYTAFSQDDYYINGNIDYAKDWQNRMLGSGLSTCATLYAGGLAVGEQSVTLATIKAQTALKGAGTWALNKIRKGRGTTSSVFDEALIKLDKSGLRPGQTEISKSRVMKIVENYDPLKAQSSVYTDSTGRYLVEGHHTTVANTMLGKGSSMNMNVPTPQIPSARNVYWVKNWYEFCKTAIKVKE